MVQIMISLKNIGPKRSFTLWKIGQCLLNLKLYKFALFWLKNSQEICHNHSLKNNLFSAKVARDIGKYNMEMNQYYDSLFYFYNALAIYKSTFSKSLDNKYVADLYFVIGHCYLDMAH